MDFSYKINFITIVILHEMLSMKLPAELFRGTRKTRTKETGNRLFCLLGVWGKRPILATAVA
ncbi:MAG: hypothetical protein L0I64_12365, partial [Lactococcus lactis]|nr:hypothetical protein [Lactococcus lactis]MDN6096227.1 hypothetical protein [Lactococcus lactis]